VSSAPCAARCSPLALFLALGLVAIVQAQPGTRTPQELLGNALNQWAAVIEPGADGSAQVLSATLRVVETEGFPQRLVGQAVDLAFQAPNRLRVSAQVQVERFVQGALSLLNLQLPTLGPATGEKRVLAVEGAGRLEDHDGTKVLFLRGTPEEMGHQHGVLMRREVRDLVSKILYGVGVASQTRYTHYNLADLLVERP
jgi:hypothetical protein